MAPSEERRRHHQQERRRQPAHASAIEAREREVGREQDPGDQVAADHEEDVDADEAARQGVRPGVVHDHGQDGDGAQAVDVGSVGRGAHRLLLLGALIIPRFDARTRMPHREPSRIASPVTVRQP